MTPFATRFAPSPNGELHLGHALSAITGHRLARRYGGRFFVRIEDIDMLRTREEHVSQILEDLHWLGLDWDEPVLRQSSRFAVYREAAERLVQQGLLYPCFATRSEIDTAVALRPTGTDPDGAPLYPGLSKGLPRSVVERRQAAGEPYCLRLDMERALDAVSRRLEGRALTFQEWDGEAGTAPQDVEADPGRWGDPVIVRKDTPASYHLAVVIDDAMQGISHVVRGRDLYAATGLHRMLQVLLGLGEPIYHHHRLIVDERSQKLSKSLGHTSLRSLRAKGCSPADICGLIGVPEV